MTKHGSVDAGALTPGHSRRWQHSRPQHTPAFPSLHSPSLPPASTRVFSRHAASAAWSAGWLLCWPPGFCIAGHPCSTCGMQFQALLIILLLNCQLFVFVVLLYIACAFQQFCVWLLSKPDDCCLGQKPVCGCEQVSNQVSSMQQAPAEQKARGSYQEMLKQQLHGAAAVPNTTSVDDSLVPRLQQSNGEASNAGMCCGSRLLHLA